MVLHLRLISVALMLSVSGAPTSEERTITPSTAERLVHEALVALKQDGPKVHVERIHYDYAPQFFAFEADRHPTPAGTVGAADILYLAVNPWTGDVWDYVTCQRITSPAIRKAQAAIRKKLNLSPEAQRRLSAKAPGCTEEKQRLATKPQ